MTTIYSALYAEWYPFDKFYPDAKKVLLRHGELPTDPNGFLIVWGGGDIHPSWYNRVNVASHVYAKPTIRDEQEARMMAKAIEIGLPIMGVCRGAQMGCALAGGILVQDVGHLHCSQHYIKSFDGKRIRTSSLHHQMLFPWEVDHELIAWSDPPLAEHYTGLNPDELKLMTKEPEIVWFPNIKCLAVQGHPEYMDHDCELNIYVHALMDKYGFNPISVS